MCSDRFGRVEKEECRPPDLILCQGGRHKAAVSPVEADQGKAGAENPVQAHRQVESSWEDHWSR